MEYVSPSYEATLTELSESLRAARRAEFLAQAVEASAEVVTIPVQQTHATVTGWEYRHLNPVA